VQRSEEGDEGAPEHSSEKGDEGAPEHSSEKGDEGAPVQRSEQGEMSSWEMAGRLLPWLLAAAAWAQMLLR
jgi:hypothetical protein